MADDERTRKIELPKVEGMNLYSFTSGATWLVPVVEIPGPGTSPVQKAVIVTPDGRFWKIPDEVGAHVEFDGDAKDVAVGGQPSRFVDWQEFDGHE